MKKQIGIIILVILNIILMLFIAIERVNHSPVDETIAVKQEVKQSTIDDVDVIGIKQRVTELEHKANRLETILYNLNEVDIKYGGISDIKTTDGLVISISQGNDTDIELELDEKCKPYFVSEIGYVASTIDELKQKVKDEKKEGFEDSYTFVVMKNKVIQILQGTYNFVN